MRELTVDGVDEIALVRLPSINLASQAFRGEAGDGSFLVDDVAAAQSFPSLKIVRLIEDASGSDKHLYRGRVISKGFTRGGDIADDARQITVGTVDSNWDLRRLRVHQWPRPSETGRARVVALGAYILNGSSSTVTNARKRPSTVIDVTTYVPNTNTVTMPANLYDATDPLAVIDDCARAEGKSYFVFIDDDGDMFLWFDVGTSTSYASTLAITDDGPDLSTTFPPIDDGQPGEEDGTELLSGAGLVDSTGTAYAQQDAGIEAANDVAEETIFDNGAGPVDATNRLTAFLDERELEELRYACAVQLRAEDAHLIKAGMTIAFRWAAAGVTSPVTLRVARCAPEHIEPDLYLLHLELGFPEKVSARIANHGRTEIIVGTTPPRVIGGTGDCEYLSFYPGVWSVDDPGTYDFDMTTVPVGSEITFGPTAGSGYDFGNTAQYTLTDDLPITGNGVFRGRLIIPNISSSKDVFFEINVHGDTDATELMLVNIRDVYVGVDGDHLGDAASYFFETEIGPSQNRTKIWPVSEVKPDAWTIDPSTTQSGGINRLSFKMQYFQSPFPPAGGQAETFIVDQLAWCFDDAVPAAYYNVWTSPQYAATADGTTATFDLPEDPAGGVIGVTAYINGNYEPAIFDATNRTFTFPNDPEAGDIIDVAWIPTV